MVDKRNIICKWKKSWFRNWKLYITNIYLNEVDQYIKHSLGIKYYFRYMDDSVLLVSSKEEAKCCLEKIKLFLDKELGVSLNKKTQIFKSKQGGEFLWL